MLWQLRKNRTYLQISRSSPKAVFFLLCKIRYWAYADNTSVDQLSMQSRVAKIESRVDGMESRVDGIESRIDGIESRLDKIESLVRRIYMIKRRYRYRKRRCLRRRPALNSNHESQT
jgi:hypothetical protein